jgi:hypothetical protein
VALVAGSIVAVVLNGIREGEEQVRVASTAKTLLEEGHTAFKTGDFVTASARFEEIQRLSTGRPDLFPIHQKATVWLSEARFANEIRASADLLSQGVADLRYHLLEGEESSRELAALLAPFRVLNDPDWSKQPKFVSLDKARKVRLLREVDELLFQFVSMIDPRDRRGCRRGIEIADRAILFTSDKKPWLALRSSLDESPLPTLTEEPMSETSPQACYQWAMLAHRQGKSRSTTEWLSRATYLDPSNAWYHFQFATILEKSDAAASVEEYGRAIVVDPTNRRYFLARARAYRLIGDWVNSAEDERWASKLAGDRGLSPNQPAR